ncbi:hypothetical protein [Myroides pelagicus]|uniref:Uncharacterized protein n=1 Tax=Myroides pelagicus TaxID=270914 RepID=A0A7K1GNP5_9FLAO|nr:hypothetical protein [Myroides pelagicus]MTH30013.1 hypothetical protein [Myroides pelagicus]
MFFVSAEIMAADWYQIDTSCGNDYYLDRDQYSDAQWVERINYYEKVRCNNDI